MEKNFPFWSDEVEAPSYPALDEDLEVDVAIVGGGIVGMHCAYRLKGSGLSTVVLEARRIGRQATGRSTAKVTTQHGRKYEKLIRAFGREGALAYADANEGAVLEIVRLAESMEGKAGLEERDAYIYAVDEDEALQLEQEAKAARSLGLPADLVHDAGLPFPTTALLKYRGQFQLDPYRYVLALAGLVGLETPIYEQSRVTGWGEDSRCHLEVNGRTVTAQHVIFATQMPIINEGRFFAKAFPFAHPVVAAPLPPDKRLEGMFISLGSPTHSLRTAEKDGQTYLIAVGGEYKGGDTKQQQDMLADLRAFIRQHFGIEELSHCWTNEDFRPMDGAAFVGPAERDSKLLIATGFDAWGISQGVVAADILADRLLGRTNEAAMLFDATRIKPVSGAFEFTKGNLEAAANLFGERLLKRGSVPLNSIAPGEAGVVSNGGDLLAVRRNEDGTLIAHSAVCTHMGCALGWNAIDRTWDCSCHGSRFDETGEVIAGPAVAPLEQRSAPDEDDEGA